MRASALEARSSFCAAKAILFWLETRESIKRKVNKINGPKYMIPTPRHSAQSGQ